MWGSAGTVGYPTVKSKQGIAAMHDTVKNC